MKFTKLFGLFVFSAILGLNFSACSDDDDDDAPKLNNSSVVGIWGFEKAVSTFEFTDEFKKDLKEEELAAANKQVEDYFTKYTKDLNLTGAKYSLDKEYKYEHKLVDKDAVKGVYKLDPALKYVEFLGEGDSKDKYELNSTTMTNVAEVSKADISLGTEGIESTDIKTATLTVSYLKMSK